MAFVIVFPNSDLQRSKHYLFYRRYNVDYNLASHETLPQQLSLSLSHTQKHTMRKKSISLLRQSLIRSSGLPGGTLELGCQWNPMIQR